METGIIGRLGKPRRGGGLHVATGNSRDRKLDSGTHVAKRAPLIRPQKYMYLHVFVQREPTVAL